jgi:hypothetical protein
MTARQTYETSVQNSGPAQNVTVSNAEGTRQEAANQSGVNVGYTVQGGNYTNFANAVKNANTAKAATLDTAERTKQATQMVARDTLRDSGDRGAA